MRRVMLRSFVTGRAIASTSVGGNTEVSRMEDVHNTDGEPCSTSVVDGSSRKYNTRSSKEARGSLKPMAELVSVKLVGEAVVDVKTIQKNRYSGRSKRSLKFDEPLGATIKESGSGATGKPVTRSKRSRPIPSETSVTTTSSGLAYFGFSDKESGIVEDGALSLLQKVDGAVTHNGPNTYVQESDATNVVVTSVTSLFGPEAISLAVQHLKAVDHRLRTVIEMNEGPKFQKCESVFVALARSIVYQQLATKAATAIYGRVEALCGGSEFLTPEVMSKLTAAELRAVGISERKASYLHDLAKHFMTGALSHPAILDMDDEALMTALTAVRGIGVWSVHMFMIFSLHRPDILPVSDLGVRKGFQKLFELKALPAPAQMEDLASKWRPYRSLGAWYMWRVLNMTLPFKTE